MKHKNEHLNLKNNKKNKLKKSTEFSYSTFNHDHDRYELTDTV
jgi:hypothetical protein